MKLIRWYHHPNIYPWITQFTLMEWIMMFATMGYLIWMCYE